MRALRDIAERLWLFWWNLWTGDRNEAATRHRLEVEVRRFGGEIRWSRTLTQGDP